MTRIQKSARIAWASLLACALAVLVFGWQPIGPRSACYAFQFLAISATVRLFHYINSKP
jgi:hypothetical protein